MDGKFRILIVQDDFTLRDCGEEPWDSYGAAEEFQRSEVGARSVIAGGHDLKLSLSKLKINRRMSKETLCFSADLLVDGNKVADVENDGGGGSHRYLWKDHFWRKIVDAWAFAQETDYPVEKLDQIVNRLTERKV